MGNDGMRKVCVVALVAVTMVFGAASGGMCQGNQHPVAGQAAAPGPGEYSLTVIAASAGVKWGTGTDEVTATVKAGDQPVAGHVIRFAAAGPASPGLFGDATATTGADGKAKDTYLAGQNGGVVTITVTDQTEPGDHTAQCTVKVIKITHQTDTDPTPRTRTKIGLGEGASCGLDGLTSGVDWNGEGAAVFVGGGATAVFTSRMSPSTVTVKAMLGEGTDSVAFSVVAPNGSDVAWDKDSDPHGPPGQGWLEADALFWVTVLPDDVSFAALRFRENIPQWQFAWPSGDVDAKAASTPAIHLVGTTNRWHDQSAYYGIPTDWMKDGNGVWQNADPHKCFPNEYQDEHGLWQAYVSVDHKWHYRAADFYGQSVEVATPGSTPAEPSIARGDYIRPYAQ